MLLTVYQGITDHKDSFHISTRRMRELLAIAGGSIWLAV
jgi:hypothetical protein